MKKFKSFLRRAKAVIAAGIVAATAAVTTVCASAETVEASSSGSSLTMSVMLENAGEQLIQSFNDLVMTLIPVVLGVLGSALVIFGIMALIKLAKKIFGKVAG